MYDVIRPNAWVCIKLPSEQVKILQIVPNATVSLGKYGCFPANLILERPYHLTYEIQDKRENESYCRLRLVPSAEVNASMLAEMDDAAPTPEENEDEDSADAVVVVEESEIASTLDKVEAAQKATTSIAAAAGSKGTETPAEGPLPLDERVTQMLTAEEISALRRDGAGAGRELIAKLMLSHTQIDRKTAFSLAKYKLLKTKKYLRHFSVLPLDVTTLTNWMVNDREASKVLELRHEMLALLSCWGNVRFTENLPCGAEPEDQTRGADAGGRWLVVDDTGGLLVAGMAERMGILNAPVDDSIKAENSTAGANKDNDEDEAAEDEVMPDAQAQPTLKEDEAAAAAPQVTEKKLPQFDDHNIASSNTITVVHTNSQPNLYLLKYYGYDVTNPKPRPPHHPLVSHLLALSWLQLLEPEHDPLYACKPEEATQAEINGWKTSRRSNYVRKHRRYHRQKHIIDSARSGGFSGLLAASSMDYISVLRHTLPLVAGGSPVVLYAQSIEPLTLLADCFSTARRTAWTASPPPAALAMTPDELERWPGSDDFPLNPALLLGVSVQTSKARRWQVLPGRTHPLMMGKGGSDGYVFTAWKTVPAAGRVEARGKFKKRRVET